MFMQHFCSKKFNALWLIFLFSSYLFSQEALLLGVVRDAGTREPIQGAIIRAEGKKATVTNAAGEFKLSAPAGKFFISIQYIGYKTHKDTLLLEAGEKRMVEFNIKPQVIQLNEVVTSSFYKKNAAKESVSMDVVNRNQIKNTNANDLSDAVSKTPGVLVQDGQITIRGGSSYSYGIGTRTAVLVDNLGMTSADLGEAQNKLVPIENTKQVEVIKGASSVVYGSSALNGIVNVITDWPTDSDPKTEIDLNTTFFDAPSEPKQRWWTGGTPFGVITNVNHQRKIKDLQLVAGGNITGAMGYLQRSNEFRFRYFAKTRHLNPKIEGLNYGVNFSQMYDRSDRYFIAPDMDTNALHFQVGSQDKYIRTTVDPHIAYQNIQGHRITCNMRYLNIWRQGNGNDINATMHSFEIQPQYQYKFRNLLVITTGVPFSYGISVSNLFPGLRKNFAAAVYVQAEVNYKLLSWIGGVRYEAIGVDTFTETSKPIFRTGLNLKAGKATFFRASWGQGYRIPSIGERFVAAEFTQGVYVVPNDTLKTETGWNLEFGIKQGFQIYEWKAYLDGALFWQEYQNFVQYEIGFYQNRYRDGTKIFPQASDMIIGLRASNLENARVVGYEISFASQGKIGPVGLQVLAGYTYTYPVVAKDTTSNSSDNINHMGNFLKKFFELNYRRPTETEINQLLMFRMRHLFRADIELTYWKMYLGTTLYYGSVPEQIPPLFRAAASVIFTNYETLDRYLAGRKGDFIADIRLGIAVNKNWKVGFIAKNITNRFYQLRPGRTEPHRNFTLQLRYSF
jgi:iron complex outermembrane receptor protein